MKREIKFRAWNKKQKVMFTPVLSKNGTALHIVYGEVGGEIKDTPVMQFTGLHDKNGKEIYEGDIFDCSTEELGIVTYSGANFQVNWCPVSTHATYLFLCAQNGSVIGNIYENPELIK